MFEPIILVLFFFCVSQHRTSARTLSCKYWVECTRISSIRWKITPETKFRIHFFLFAFLAFTFSSANTFDIIHQVFAHCSMTSTQTNSIVERWAFAQKRSIFSHLSLPWYVYRVHCWTNPIQWMHFNIGIVRLNWKWNRAFAQTCAIFVLCEFHYLFFRGGFLVCSTFECECCWNIALSIMCNIYDTIFNVWIDHFFLPFYSSRKCFLHLFLYFIIMLDFSVLCVSDLKHFLVVLIANGGVLTCVLRTEPYLGPFWRGLKLLVLVEPEWFSETNVMRITDMSPWDSRERYSECQDSFCLPKGQTIITTTDRITCSSYSFWNGDKTYNNTSFPKAH